jgi:predicted RND superfamily exporter protein
MSGLSTSVSQSDSRITGVNSFATLLSAGGSTPDFSRQAIDDAIKSAPPAIVNGFITPDPTSADINGTIAHDVPLIEQSSIIDNITQNAHPPQGVTMTAAGLGVIGVAAETQLTSHRLEMTFIALLAVLLLLLAVTRNIAYTVIVTLPIALVIGWTSAAMYVLQVPLNPLTAIAGPLVVALGTEFGILLMMRYREERENGLAPQDAMATAYRLSGRAIAASAFTVVGAFLALAFHPFPLLSQFGIVAVLGVALSFAGAMLVMPPLLVWSDETFSRVGEAVHHTPL